MMVTFETTVQDTVSPKTVSDHQFRCLVCFNCLSYQPFSAGQQSFTSNLQPFSDAVLCLATGQLHLSSHRSTHPTHHSHGCSLSVLSLPSSNRHSWTSRHRSLSHLTSRGLLDGLNLLHLTRLSWTTFNRKVSFTWTWRGHLSKSCHP